MNIKKVIVLALYIFVIDCFQQKIYAMDPRTPEESVITRKKKIVPVQRPVAVKGGKRSASYRGGRGAYRRNVRTARGRVKVTRGRQQRSYPRTRSASPSRIAPDIQRSTVSDKTPEIKAGVVKSVQKTEGVSGAGSEKMVSGAGVNALVDHLTELLEGLRKQRLAAKAAKADVEEKRAAETGVQARMRADEAHKAARIIRDVYEQLILLLQEESGAALKEAHDLEDYAARIEEAERAAK